MIANSFTLNVITEASLVSLLYKRTNHKAASKSQSQASGKHRGHRAITDPRESSALIGIVTA